MELGRSAAVVHSAGRRRRPWRRRLDSAPSRRGFALHRTSRSHAVPHPYDDDVPEPSRLRCECRDRGEEEEEEEPEPNAGNAERLKEWETKDG